MERRGQLKIQAFANYGILTLHVIQGRSLSCKRKEPCNAYIKVCLSPDHSRRARCKTDVVPNTCSPQFNEKFSFELLEEDMRKRLLISVYNRDPLTSHSEFLGCTSFGIHNIVTQNKVLDGWYYLLGDELGARKHLAVASKSGFSSASSDGGRPGETILHHHSAGGSQHSLGQQRNLSGHVPDILDHPRPAGSLDQRSLGDGSVDTDDLEPHVFVLKRGVLGYGFSLIGEGPAQVSRVEPDSPAESMGVQIGDYIIRINGINVSRSTADSVARIVKNAEQQLVLEVERMETFKKPLPPAPPARGCYSDTDEDVYMDMYGTRQRIPPPPFHAHDGNTRGVGDGPGYHSLDDDDSFHGDNIYATLPANLPSSTPYNAAPRRMPLRVREQPQLAEQTYQQPPVPRSRVSRSRLQHHPHSHYRDPRARSHDPHAQYDTRRYPSPERRGSHDYNHQQQQLYQQQQQQQHYQQQLYQQQQQQYYDPHETQPYMPNEQLYGTHQQVYQAAPQQQQQQKSKNRLPQCISGDRGDKENKPKSGKLGFFVCGGIRSSKVNK